MARRLSILSLLLVTALMAVTGYWLLFTAFMSHDDEGYVLVSLKNYSAHGGLYAQVYSQYGPFFYLLHDFGHRLLNYGFTNTNGRYITLCCWIGAALACAHLVWRHTRSLTLTTFTLCLTFFYLWLMVSEPIHPGGLIALIAAAGAWWGARQIERRDMPSLAGAAALAGTTLLLIKINVGGFFLAAAGTWFAIQLRDIRQGGRISALLTALLVLLPLGLMWTEIGEPWARLFATLSAIANLTMLAAAWNQRQPMTDWSNARWGGGIGLVFGAFAILAVCLRGTSLAQMGEGILVGPLRHPGVYHYPPDWKPGAGLIGGFSLLLAIVFWNVQSVRLSCLLVAIRLLLVAEFSLASLDWLPFTSHSSVMSYAVPLAWVFVLRLAPDEKKLHPPVAPWVGLLLVLQYLHAYPVAGSQIAWGTFLIVPLMALGLHDTQRFLLRHKPSVTATVVGTFCCVVGILSVGRLGVVGWHRYTESRPLRLSGAEDIRVPEQFASTLRVLSLNATVHGDMLFSLPGMYSFNDWTQLPTPTYANTTHWFSLLNRGEQDAIAAALSQSKRPVLIVHQGLIEFLTDSHFVVGGPLNDYLHENFARVFKLGRYEFLVRRGRNVVALATAELLQLKSPEPGMAPYRLELVVAIPPGHQVASIELVSLEFETNSQLVQRWDKSSGPLFSTAINLQGSALAAEHVSAWETSLPALVRLDLPLTAPVNFVRRYSIVYLRDSDGSVTAEARFTE